MYFVDRTKITATCKHLDEILAIFEAQDNWTTDAVAQLALQRIAHNAMEAMMDVGNVMIDGFVMRDPGSYDDIIDILLDEKVIPADMEAPLKAVVDLRKMLVRDFIAVDNDRVYTVFSENLPQLKRFSGLVQDYLVNELGPVSAFLPEKE